MSITSKECPRERLEDASLGELFGWYWGFGLEGDSGVDSGCDEGGYSV